MKISTLFQKRKYRKWPCKVTTVIYSNCAATPKRQFIMTGPGFRVCALPAMLVKRDTLPQLAKSLVVYFVHKCILSISQYVDCGEI